VTPVDLARSASYRDAGMSRSGFELCIVKGPQRGAVFAYRLASRYQVGRQRGG
jgi:hypothetical protein